MLKFRTTSEPGVSKAEVFFPNKKGASVLRTQRLGEPDFFEITLTLGSEGNISLHPEDCQFAHNETECNEIIENIRILSPD